MIEMQIIKVVCFGALFRYEDRDSKNLGGLF